MLLLLLNLLQSSARPADTLRIHTAQVAPRAGQPVDRSRFGPPQLRLGTNQGTAELWLLRAADSFFVVVVVPDTTPYWGDAFVLSMNVRGQGGDRPGHDDFQWHFRRMLDSSVVYRGRGGHWEAPRGDPDWRLGAERTGGGWEVSSRDDRTGWSLIIRLDPAWLESSEGRLPRIAFRIYDDSPQGRFAWPARAGATATSIEQTPSLWGYLVE